MKKIVIIPAYNEQGSILNTIEDIRKNAPDFDYVVINDCSKDDTLKLCRKNGIRVLDLPINLGIGGAVQTGTYMHIETIMIWQYSLMGMGSMMQNSWI